MEFNRKKVIWGISCIIITAAALVAAFKGPWLSDAPDAPTQEITVTAEDLEQYRRDIGSSMDVKKSVLIIFNTQEECRNFITAHGAEKGVLDLGEGILPQMQEENGERYFNVVGNSIFEPLFEGMGDGEFLDHPVEFGGTFCYFKRLENYSITQNDESLTAFIRKEKAMEKGGMIE